jgi:hypothetical protein
MKVPRNTTMGGNVVAVPAASDFSSHCPAEIKDKFHIYIFLIQEHFNTVFTMD